MDRRDFLLKTLLASSAVSLVGLSMEERALLASAQFPRMEPEPENTGPLPTGKIGNVEITRLIQGGNLVGGYAHSRDLIYVSSLFRQYFTEEKIIEVYRISEEQGVNTVILNNSERDIGPINYLRKYCDEMGGKLQWIAQSNPTADDVETNIRMAVDNGAVGAFIQGQLADRWVQEDQLDLIEKTVSFIKANGLIAGSGGHELQTTMAIEEAGIDVDFYMKTFHSPDYWSFNPANVDYDDPATGTTGTRDNVWDTNPEATAEFMQNMTKPWIAYKTLAAGAIRPRDGFKYCFENGADFLCVGMFDFQIADDVNIAKNVLDEPLDRARPWRA